ncbi:MULTISPECIES: anti-sigma regulatory factor [unclassified Anaeromyxobacter]|uniref:anti-sigma regulatory factor n=1 Tax=unclassified Anaeromyxobacter TaxID=2620896 RepID=UPI001F5AE8D9|nr:MULTISPECIES: anti-sigma regulatory factor [unclassified Anaeromyxobacter]
MPVVKEETVAIRSDADVVLVRQRVRRRAQELRFSLVDQTKLVTAASELARNALEHGRGGEMLLQVLEEPPRSGLRLVFVDRGPGISNVELAMKDGYTTGGGLGLGLGGAKRLVNEFAVESAPGAGTRVTVTKWH